MVAKHAVMAGETLGSITQFYYQTLDATFPLAEANGLAVPDDLRAGKTLELPPVLFFKGNVCKQGPGDFRMDLRKIPRRADLVFIQVREDLRLQVTPFTSPKKQDQALSHRWLYVFNAGKAVMEIRIGAEDEWEIIEDTIFPKRALVVVDGRLPLKRQGPYGFFLSPFQLTKTAKNEFAPHAETCPTVELIPADTDQTIYVRDLMAYTLTLHKDVYAPAIAAWQQWVEDPTRSAQFFIASALKAIIANGDKADVQDELDKGQPQKFLDDFQTNEKPFRKRFEEAMAAIARYIDSRGCLAIENTAMERGGDDLKFLTVYFAQVLGGLAQCHPGRILAVRLVSNEKRLFRQFIFNESPPKPDLDFGTERYVTLAVLTLIQSLGPAMAEAFRNKKVDIIKEFKKYLERIGGVELPEETTKKVERNAKRGRSLTHGLKGRHRTFRKLVARFDPKSTITIPNWVKKYERISKIFDHDLFYVARPISIALEVVNLSAAASDIAGDAKDPKKIIGLLGASADFGLMVREIVGESSKWLAKKAVGGVLGLVSGVCDTIGFIGNAKEDIGKCDYGKFIGHSIAAAGSAAIALAGFVVIAQTGVLGVGAAGVAATIAAWGWVGFGIGALVVGAGVLIAYLFSSNEYEEFAKFCFLGSKRTSTRNSLHWSPFELPTSNIEQEKKALICLLSNFRVSAHSDSGMYIYPGHYSEGDIFVIRLVERYMNYQANQAILTISMEDGEVTQLAGRPLVPDSRVQFDKDGRIESIYISADEANPPSYPKILQFEARIVQARLKLGSSIFLPLTKPDQCKGENLGKVKWVEAILAPRLLVVGRIQGNSTDASSLKWAEPVAIES